MILSTNENIKDGIVRPPKKTLISASIPIKRKKYRKNSTTTANITIVQNLICSLDIFSNHWYLTAMIPTINIIRY